MSPTDQRTTWVVPLPKAPELPGLIQEPVVPAGVPKEPAIPAEEVYGFDRGHGYGVRGDSITGEGVRGQSASGIGVCGRVDGGGVGVGGISSQGGYGVAGTIEEGGGVGVFGRSPAGVGIWGESTTGIAGRFTGSVAVSGAAAIGGDLVVGGDVAVGTDTEPAALGIHGSATIDSVLTVGGAALPSRVNVYGDIAASGDVFLTGADCAEDFEVASAEVEPGTVMVIADDGTLQPSQVPYDRRVAGVVSGAGDARPGIRLGSKHDASPRVPVGLSGRVYCWVDASYGPVAVGDLLTTSPTPGHAMRATDAGRAFGAVLGKALRQLDAGSGLVPVLIALQ